MIELNLLPDVKLDYIKAQRNSRLIFGIAAVVTIAAIAILVLLLGYSAIKKKHLNDLSRDIKNESSQLQKKPDINKILTVQNQLESLTDLHSAKPAASQLFDYLNQTTPVNVTISSMNIDFTAYTLSLTGDTDALSSVNKYIDTLKYTTYTTDTNTAKAKAFSDVVLSSFALNQSGDTAGQADAPKPATYTITLSYDKTIFDITQKISLGVPNITTTRASIEQPNALFQASTNPTSKGSN